MIPTGLRHPSLTFIDNAFHTSDVLNNLILYMPLGIALSGWSLTRALLYGLGLSTSAELLQLGYIDRTPSFADIASNTAGAVIGYLAARVFLSTGAKGPRSVGILRPVAAAAIPIAILGTLALLHNRPPSDFSNWNPGFQLAVGNELSGDRPWTGTISELAIYPFAMSPSQINDFVHQSRDSNAVEKIPGEAPIVGPLQAVDLSTHFGRPLLSPQDELRLYDTLTTSNQLTLLVAMRTSNLEQSGPARIVTYSADAWGRNFTLGQIRNTLTFRLRTPASGGNGVDPALYSGPVLSLNSTSLVAAVYDGRFSSLYVDGKRVAQADLGTRTPRLPRRILMWLPNSVPVREIELVGAEVLLSGLFAIGIFGLVGVPRRPLIRFFLGAAAGAAIAATIWTFAVSRPGLGSRILLECVGAGLVISASVETQTTNA
jgi:VanZ like family/Concanavalin A-like lectin/glucanases superfamily